MHRPCRNPKKCRRRAKLAAMQFAQRQAATKRKRARDWCRWVGLTRQVRRAGWTRQTRSRVKYFARMFTSVVGPIDPVYSFNAVA